MFNKDFFPTPDSVIDIMLQHAVITGKTVLEPSAGKGNIVDYLKLSMLKIPCKMNSKATQVILGDTNSRKLREAIELIERADAKLSSII